MLLTETHYSTDEAADLAGLTYRQVDFYVRQGYVEPRNARSGSGTRRRFTRSDVLALRVTKVLVGNRVERSVIQWAIDHLAIPAGYLWVQDEIVGLGGMFDLLDAMAHVPGTIVVNLSTLRAGL